MDEVKEAVLRAPSIFPLKLAWPPLMYIIYIYILYITPELRLRNAFPGREREHGHFRWNTEGAEGSTEGAEGAEGAWGTSREHRDAAQKQSTRELKLAPLCPAEAVYGTYNNSCERYCLA